MLNSLPDTRSLKQILDHLECNFSLNEFPNRHLKYIISNYAVLTGYCKYINCTEIWHSMKHGS